MRKRQGFWRLPDEGRWTGIEVGENEVRPPGILRPIIRKEIIMRHLHRPASTIVCALASLLVLTTVHLSPAKADDPGGKFAAIAYSEQSGRYGYAYGCTCLPDAQNNAVANCGAADAHVVVWVENGWVALAVGDNGAYGDAWSTSSVAEAEAIALQNCSQYGGNAHIAVWASAG
jgi:hypothetical protein